MHVPSWSDHNASFTENLQWVDGEGCQHGLTIRCDTLDDLVRQLIAVKVLIASARAKAAAAKGAAPTQATADTPLADAMPQLSRRRCELHDAPMFKAVSKRTGRPYASHMTADGERCFGKKL